MNVSRTLGRRKGNYRETPRRRFEFWFAWQVVASVATLGEIAGAATEAYLDFCDRSRMPGLSSGVPMKIMPAASRAALISIKLAITRYSLLGLVPPFLVVLAHAPADGRQLHRHSLQ